MNDVATALKAMLEAGVPADVIVDAIAKMVDAIPRAETPEERRRRISRETSARARAKARDANTSPNVTKRHQEPVTRGDVYASPVTNTRHQMSPLARVEDNLNTTEEPCLSLSLDFARECAGEAMASPARSQGIMVLRELVMAQQQGCTLDEIGDGIRQAAAWHLKRDGPGSMTSWTLAAKIARQFRDKRLNPPPAVIPLEPRNDRPDPASKRAARHANFGRSLAGLEAVAASRAGNG